MILTAWNCDMGFHRKFAALAQFESDILVISECSSPDVLRERGLRLDNYNCIWVGDDPRKKGIAVIARVPYQVEPLFDDLSELPIWVVPVRITTPQGEKVDLLAVWSFNHRDKRNNGGSPLVDGLTLFASRLSFASLCVAGDFNNSVIWDREGKATNHQRTSDALSSLGLASAYHRVGGHLYGAEPEPTMYWRDRTLDGPRYHIDYVYLPTPWLQPPTVVSVGSYANWVAPKLSNHVPISVDIPMIR